MWKVQPLCGCLENVVYPKSESQIKSAAVPASKDLSDVARAVIV